MSSGRCGLCFSPLSAGETCARCGPAAADASDSGDTLQPGALLNDKYLLGRLLGRGGFGATYLAWDDNLQVRVAIKEYLPRQLASRTRDGSRVYPYTGDKEAYDAGLKQFLAEAQNLARFRAFPGIVAVLDYFGASGTGYMVMEHLEGGTLEEHVGAHGRLELKVALSQIRPVADALRACHAEGLIHRDVSPDNIFLTKDDHVKLIDFGAARVAVSAKSLNLSVILKEGYAPFEQYQRNGRQGPWTDVYALCASLYRLITGQVPPTAADRAGGTALPTLAEAGVDAPASLQALLDKGMAMAVDKRHQTMVELSGDLREAYDDLDRERKPLQAGRRAGRNRAIAAAVAVLVAPAVAWAIISIQPSPSPAPATETTDTPAATTSVQPLPPPSVEPAETVKIDPSAVSIPTLRQWVRKAVEAQAQLQFKTGRLKAGRELLGTYQATGRQDLVQRQQGYNAADETACEELLEEYVAHVATLANQNTADVQRALQIQRDEHRRPAPDPDAAANDRWAISAIALLEDHVAERRAGTFSREAARQAVLRARGSAGVGGAGG